MCVCVYVCLCVCMYVFPEAVHQFCSSSKTVLPPPRQSSKTPLFCLPVPACLPLAWPFACPPALPPARPPAPACRSDNRASNAAAHLLPLVFLSSDFRVRVAVPLFCRARAENQRDAQGAQSRAHARGVQGLQGGPKPCARRPLHRLYARALQQAQHTASEAPNPLDAAGFFALACPHRGLSVFGARVAPALSSVGQHAHHAAARRQLQRAHARACMDALLATWHRAHATHRHDDRACVWLAQGRPEREPAGGEGRSIEREAEHCFAAVGPANNRGCVRGSGGVS